jgi:oligopeptide/dipeptide ABC transporter ATP-binding protein
MTPASFSDRPILVVEGLTVGFMTSSGLVRAADDVCFSLCRNETLALVGETGCGKSVVASAIMKLLPRNASVQGHAFYSGRDLLALSEKEMSHIRGRDISIVFQNPSLSLNPIIRVAEQVAEPLQVHGSVSRSKSKRKAEEMLERLGLNGRQTQMYPFQFSGGMNQRAMIATSMMLNPRMIIADEPSKGLDAGLADETMSEMLKIKEQIGSSLLLITHDLNLARRFSDRIAVMYCGEIVESGKSGEIFAKALHPYTRALLGCMPERGFHPIPGSSPSMINPPEGCKFHPRCPQAQEVCKRRPAIAKAKGGAAEGSVREVRCWLY